MASLGRGLRQAQPEVLFGTPGFPGNRCGGDANRGVELVDGGTSFLGHPGEDVAERLAAGRERDLHVGIDPTVEDDGAAGE